MAAVHAREDRPLERFHSVGYFALYESEILLPFDAALFQFAICLLERFV